MAAERKKFPARQKWQSNRKIANALRWQFSVLLSITQGKPWERPGGMPATGTERGGAIQGGDGLAQPLGEVAGEVGHIVILEGGFHETSLYHW